MKISHFLYNAFVIEHGPSRIVIDPGVNLWMFGWHSLVPKALWDGVTHVLVTHGDPDHYVQADRVALAANAPLMMNPQMLKNAGSGTQILAPRQGGLRYVPFSGRLIPIEVGETVLVDGVSVRGIKTQHGPIEINVLGYKHRIQPGPDERTGFGAMGFEIEVGGVTIVNLGYSLIQQEWATLDPDILMLPIGGLGNQTWTMDTADALAAVKLMRPKVVIPCHYNVPFLWRRKMALADDIQFKKDVEALGIRCCIMSSGSSFDYARDTAGSPA